MCIFFMLSFLIIYSKLNSTIDKHFSRRLLILFCSGDGTLSVFNIRRKRFEARSENQENELLSLAIFKVSASFFVD